MWVDFRICPSGSTPGWMYCASFGFVMSTAGHCSNCRSEKLSRSWSKARTLNLPEDIRRIHSAQAKGWKIPLADLTHLRLSIQSPSSSSRVPRGCRLWRTGIRPPRVCRWPHRYATAELQNKTSVLLLKQDDKKNSNPDCSPLLNLILCRTIFCSSYRSKCLQVCLHDLGPSNYGIICPFIMTNLLQLLQVGAACVQQPLAL